MKYRWVVTADAPPAPVRTGRPRSERARLAVLEAAADLLVEGGLAAATIEAVAARAQVSKVTIYKWWPSRGSVAVDAYFHRYRQTDEFEDTGDLTSDPVAGTPAACLGCRAKAGRCPGPGPPRPRRRCRPRPAVRAPLLPAGHAARAPDRRPGRRARRHRARRDPAVSRPPRPGSLSVGRATGGRRLSRQSG